MVDSLRSPPNVARPVRSDAPNAVRDAETKAAVESAAALGLSEASSAPAQKADPAAGRSADRSAAAREAHQRAAAAVPVPAASTTTATPAARAQALQRDAKALYQATKGGLTGLGTDEAAVFRILDKHARAGTIDKLTRAYAKENRNRDMRKDVLSELSPTFSPHDHQRATALLDGNRALGDAVRAHGAMKGGITGAGTDEKGVLAAVHGKTPEEAGKFLAAYRERYGVPFHDHLDGEMSVSWSGNAKERVLGALRGDRPGAVRDPLGRYEARGMPDADPATGAKLSAFAALASVAPGTLQQQAFKQAGIDGFRRIDADGGTRIEKPRFAVPADVAARKPHDMASIGASTSVLGDQPLTISELHEAYKSGKTTPTEVAKRFIDSVKRSDAGATPLRAFIATHEQDILQQAAASTERYRQGKPKGPLDGAPVAVKGQLDVKGYGTTAGSAHMGKKPAAADAAVVDNVRSQGALIVGTTNMHELGYGVRGENPFHGVARNPYDKERVAGGSSGGSASAVASGLVVAAIGSDAGGSIRVPAAHNGIVGLKPTYGLLDERGNTGLAPTLQSSGPMAATAGDAAKLLDAMMGTSAKARVDLSRVGDTKDLSDVTVGVYKGWNQHADPDVVQATSKMIDGLKARGAKIKEIEINGLNSAGAAQMVTFSREIAALQAADRKAGGRYSAEVKVNLALADGLTDKDLQRAQRVRGVLSGEMERVFKSVDVVLTPATGMTAPKVIPAAGSTGSSNLAELDATSRFTTLANLTGHPAGVFPSGYDQNGMPIGAQLIGRPYEEGKILRLAAAAGEITARRKPKDSYELLPRAR